MRLVVQRCRDCELLERPLHDIGVVDFDQVAGFEKRFRQLFNEERHAVGPRSDLSRHRFRNGFPATDSKHHGRDVVRGQPRQFDGADVRRSPK